MSQTLQDRLKATRAAIDEKRDQRAEAMKERDSAKEKFAGATDVEPGKMTEHPDFKAAEQAVGKVGKLDDQLADLALAERGLLAMMGSSEPPVSENGPADPSAPRAGGWDGGAILQGEAYKALMESGAIHSKSRLGSIALGRMGDREASAAFMAGRSMAAEVGSANMVGATTADRRGIIAPNLRRLTLLDLIPFGTTDSNLIEYVQVLTQPDAARETAEGDLKPEAGFTTQDEDAPVRTIAGWLKVRKQALADIAGLRTLLETLLPYDVRKRLENQVLVGNGVGQNLRGILNTTGIGAPAPVAGDNTADAILRAMTVIIMSDGDPNFTAVHPFTWQALLLMRENEAERTGAYLYGSPSTPAAPTIWGLSITANRVVPSDSPLVGDSMACTILIREGLQTLVSDQDQDDFVRNRVTILAELRAAFPVWRPSSFAVASTGGSGD